MNITLWLGIAAFVLVSTFILIKPLFKPHREVAIALFILIPLLTLSLYGYLDYSRELNQWWISERQEGIVKQMLNHSPREIMDQLKTRLQQDPNQPQGWYLLGNLYLGMKRYPEAVQALSKANQLQGGIAKIQLALAEALFFANRHQLNAQSKQLIQEVLKEEPDNINAINLLALDAYHAKRYPQAIGYWEKLLPRFPENSESHQMLLQLIANAKKKM